MKDIITCPRCGGQIEFDVETQQCFWCDTCSYPEPMEVVERTTLFSPYFNNTNTRELRLSYDGEIFYVEFGGRSRGLYNTEAEARDEYNRVISEQQLMNITR